MSTSELEGLHVAKRIFGISPKAATMLLNIAFPNFKGGILCHSHIYGNRPGIDVSLDGQNIFPLATCSDSPIDKESAVFFVRNSRTVNYSGVVAEKPILQLRTRKHDYDAVSKFPVVRVGRGWGSYIGSTTTTKNPITHERYFYPGTEKKEFPQENALGKIRTIKIPDLKNSEIFFVFMELKTKAGKTITIPYFDTIPNKRHKTTSSADLQSLTVPYMVREMVDGTVTWQIYNPKTKKPIRIGEGELFGKEQGNFIWNGPGCLDAMNFAGYECYSRPSVSISDSPDFFSMMKAQLGIGAPNRSAAEDVPTVPISGLAAIRATQGAIISRTEEHPPVIQNRHSSLATRPATTEAGFGEFLEIFFFHFIPQLLHRDGYRIAATPLPASMTRQVEPESLSYDYDMPADTHAAASSAPAGGGGGKGGGGGGGGRSGSDGGGVSGWGSGYSVPLGGDGNGGWADANVKCDGSIDDGCMTTQVGHDAYAHDFQDGGQAFTSSHGLIETHSHWSPFHGTVIDSVTVHGSGADRDGSWERG